MKAAREKGARWREGRTDGGEDYLGNRVACLPHAHHLVFSFSFSLFPGRTKTRIRVDTVEYCMYSMETSALKAAALSETTPFLIV